MRCSPVVEPRIGIIGCGTFGRFMAANLAMHLPVLVTDTDIPADVPANVIPSGLNSVCACEIVIIATPVDAVRDVCRSIAPLLRAGTLVMDVGSVKMEPSRTMLEELPDDVDVLATHPMFGPNSVGEGLAGLKLVVCPLRGRRFWRATAFLRKNFKLSIILATPEEHDEEAAFSQGLTHLLAKVLLTMDRLPARITTRSYDLMRHALEMVRDDTVGVTHAIEATNPFALAAREAFFQRLGDVRETYLDMPEAPQSGV